MKLGAAADYCSSFDPTHCCLTRPKIQSILPALSARWLGFYEADWLNSHTSWYISTITMKCQSGGEQPFTAALQSLSTSYRCLAPVNTARRSKSNLSMHRLIEPT
jgi:hypothetical protein